MVTDFWQTFPGVVMAVPFLLVCGCVAVWFLGQKGFCTYACPYGGFFALDRYAPSASASTTTASSAATAPRSARATFACMRKWPATAWWWIPGA